jgi:hypothetical protein
MADLKFWNIPKNPGQSSPQNRTTMCENTWTLTLSLNYRTEPVNSGGNISNLYSWGAQFESQPGYQLSQLKFAVFFSPSRQIPVWYLDQATITSFQILSNSFFTKYSTIQHYIVYKGTVS